MCGIAGVWQRQSGGAGARRIAARMAGRLQHRGPDDDGVWADEYAGVALGFRRLAIVDLSPLGCQPMHSASGRFTITFNGEIYNFLELRRELEERGHTFRGHSDTEVLLGAIEQRGIVGALQRAVGMFALALWDATSNTLTLARDRLGQKPLYYGRAGDALVFGSELKALRQHPAFDPEIDRGAIAQLLRYMYIPSPRTIFRQVQQLRPGHAVTFRAPDDDATPVPYWSLEAAVAQGLSDPLGCSETEAAEELERRLRASIQQHMIADVPLGAFLSGGIDSSTVVALMQAQSSRPVRTFSIGFYEAGYDEATYARSVAQHLGTDHTELYVTPAEAQAVIPRLPEIYDEPFADPSQIPTFLVSQLARQHVTVSLSGDGGDELFSGYSRYVVAANLWRRLQALPSGARAMLAAGVTAVPPGAYDRWLGGAAGALGPGAYRGVLGDKLHKAARLLSAQSPDALYRQLVSHWQDPADVVLGTEEPLAPVDRDNAAGLSDFRQRMMYADTLSYLPDDILVKVDRASMAVSLEARVPLLDHRIVEFAWRVPLAMKIRGNQGKWLLRKVLYRHVPRTLVERPKMGFGVPLDSWLRGALRDWAGALLDEGRLRREGYLDPAPVRQKWAEHLSGKRNWQYPLWDVLMFQAWLEHWQNDAPVAAEDDLVALSIPPAGSA